MRWWVKQERCVTRTSVGPVMAYFGYDHYDMLAIVLRS